MANSKISQETHEMDLKIGNHKTRTTYRHGTFNPAFRSGPSDNVITRFRGEAVILRDQSFHFYQMNKPFTGQRQLKNSLLATEWLFFLFQSEQSRTMVTNGGGVVITTDSHVNTNSGKDPKMEENL